MTCPDRYFVACRFAEEEAPRSRVRSPVSDLVLAVGPPRRESMRETTANPDTRCPGRGTGKQICRRIPGTNAGYDCTICFNKQDSEIDAPRRAAFLDRACDTDSELGNERGGLRESDKTPGWLKRPDRPDAEPRLRQALEILKRKLSQSAPVAALEIRLGY
jgi:hypothetical protein